jgi:hypothetical protein
MYRGFQIERNAVNVFVKTKECYTYLVRCIYRGPLSAYSEARLLHQQWVHSRRTRIRRDLSALPPASGNGTWYILRHTTATRKDPNERRRWAVVGMSVLAEFARDHQIRSSSGDRVQKVGQHARRTCLLAFLGRRVFSYLRQRLWMNVHLPVVSSRPRTWAALQ